MNFYKSQLNKIKIALGLESETIVSVLKDGVTRVETDALETGSTLYVVSEAGEKEKAPVGTHTLENGTEVTVDEEGVITQIKEAEVEVELAEEEKKEEEEVKVEMSEEAVDKKIEEAMAKVFMAVEEVAKEIGSIKEEMGAYKTKMEKMSATPASKKISKFNFEADEPQNALEAKLETLKSLRESFSATKRFKN